MSKFNFAAYIETIKSKKDDEGNRRRANTKKLRQFIGLKIKYKTSHFSGINFILHV